MSILIQLIILKCVYAKLKRIGYMRNWAHWRRVYLDNFRDRERERETERDRERQRETERDRERQRETERDRERE